MILKLIVVVGIIALVYFIFIKKSTPVQHSRKKNRDEEEDSSDMVQCSTCGIYCDLESSLLSNNKYYCSQDCLEKA